MNAIMRLHRAQMGAQGGGADTPAYMEHLVGAYTFKGRSNDDADRAILYDNSGRGNNLTVKDSFGWGTLALNGYDYRLGFADDALIFRGDRVATVTFDENISGWTFIFDRDILLFPQSDFGALMWCGTGTPIYTTMEFNGSDIDSVVYGNSIDSGRYRLVTSTQKTGVTWMAGGFVDNKEMNEMTERALTKTFNLGGYSGSWLYRLRSLHIFNTSLSPEEVEHFVKTNIDPTYTLP